MRPLTGYLKRLQPFMPSFGTDLISFLKESDGFNYAHILPIIRIWGACRNLHKKSLLILGGN